MTDTDKLKRLAEAATGILASGATWADDLDVKNAIRSENHERIYGALADPAFILALIAENERTESQRDKAINQVCLWIEEHDRVKSQRDEAVALLRKLNFASRPEVGAFLARIDAAE